jgi:hypothetical protein
MNEHEANQLAALVAREWSAPMTWIEGQPEADPPGGPRVGAYWPLGSPAPVRAHPARRFHFLAAHALGTNVVVCFTLDEHPRQYLLCIDVSRWPADGPLITTGSVDETIMRLIGSQNWAETQQGVLEVSPSLTIVLPGK